MAKSSVGVVRGLPIRQGRAGDIGTCALICHTLSTGISSLGFGIVTRITRFDLAAGTLQP